MEELPETNKAPEFARSGGAVPVERKKEALAREAGRKQPGRRQELRYSLADQLRGKNLELFSPGSKGEE
jgi:hypothetical protein